MASVQMDERVKWVEDAYADFVIALARASESPLYEGEDCVSVVTQQPIGIGTAILLRFSEDSVEQRLDQILDSCKAIQAASNWIIGPSARPHDIVARLRKRGYHCMGRMSAMVLDSIKLDRLPIARDDILVTRSLNPEFLEPPTTPRRKFGQAAFRKLMHDAAGECIQLQVHQGAKLIGHACVFKIGVRAGIQDVVVNEHFRGRGIGKALMRESLVASHEMGCEYAVLAATNLGARLYTACGFEQVGELHLYKYGKTRQLRGRD